MTIENDTPLLNIQHISKTFGDTRALTDFSLCLKQGSFCCLLGPSGCGKSTALRIIAGLDTPDDGTIHINGININNVPPQKRSVGMVFQNYALFPHMDVAENIAFGLHGQTAEQKKVIISKMLDMVRLSGYANRSISELSGGEQQRVALARSLARNPKLLLLDEPFSNLDIRLKESMHEELLELIRQVNITTILVTHDQEEAMSLGDTIVLMNHGKIEQAGTPQELYYRPESSFCANSLGRVNLFDKKTFLHLFSGTDLPQEKSSYLHVAIRPESFRQAANGEKAIELEITRATFHGSFFRYLARPTAPGWEHLEIILEQAADNRRMYKGEKHRFIYDESAPRFLSC